MKWLNALLIVMIVLCAATMAMSQTCPNCGSTVSWSSGSTGGTFVAARTVTRVHMRSYGSSSGYSYSGGSSGGTPTQVMMVQRSRPLQTLRSVLVPRQTIWVEQSNGNNVDGSTQCECGCDCPNCNCNRTVQTKAAVRTTPPPAPPSATSTAPK